MTADTGQWRLTAEEVAAGIDTLPSLPAAVVELISTIDRDDVDTEAIARKIGQDQGLSARILRVANSPFYGQSNRVATIGDAVVVLGLRAVRTMATAAAVTGAIRPDPASGFDLQAFWKHSIGTALLARVIAGQRRGNSDEAFTAGLLHDIGRVALVQCFPQHAAEVARVRDEVDCHTLDAERAVIGIDHALIGKLLALRWRFPKPLAEAIGHHHAPPENAGSGVSCVLHVADALAYALAFDDNDRVMMPRVHPGCWAGLALSWDESRSIFEEADRQFEAISNILLN
jgi:putative nucleotidyltransferase with HDIG domain